MRPRQTRARAVPGTDGGPVWWQWTGRRAIDERQIQTELRKTMRKQVQGLIAARRRIAAALIGGVAPLVLGVSPAFAGNAAGINISPNSDGLPGISQGEKLVGAVLTIAVIAAVAGLAMGAVVWALGSHSSNPQLQSRGKTGVLSGIIAAILAGGALVIINFFYNIGAQL